MEEHSRQGRRRSGLREIAGGDLGAPVSTMSGDTGSLLAAMGEMREAPQAAVRRMVVCADGLGGSVEQATGQIKGAGGGVEKTMQENHDLTSRVISSSAGATGSIAQISYTTDSVAAAIAEVSGALGGQSEPHRQAQTKKPPRSPGTASSVVLPYTPLSGTALLRSTRSARSPTRRRPG